MRLGRVYEGAPRNCEKAFKMLASDFGLAFLFLIVISFYLLRNYSMATRVWMACASCLLFAGTTALTFMIAWLI